MIDIRFDLYVVNVSKQFLKYYLYIYTSPKLIILNAIVCFRLGELVALFSPFCAGLNKLFFNLLVLGKSRFSPKMF